MVFMERLILLLKYCPQVLKSRARWTNLKCMKTAELKSIGLLNPQNKTARGYILQAGKFEKFAELKAAIESRILNTSFNF